MQIPVWTFWLSLFAPSASWASEVHYPSNPAGDRDRIFVSDNGIVALTGDGAEIVWQALSGVLTFEPVVAGDRVYVGAADGLHALRRADGGRLWTLPSMQFIYSPAATGELIFAGGRDGVLRAVYADTGKTLWQRRWNFWVYPPAVVGSRLIFGGAAHALYAVDRASGDDLWRTDLDNELVYRPVTAGNGGVAATTFGGTVYMLDASDGEIVWAAHDGVASRPPLFADGVALSIGLDYVLRARDGDSGRRLWSRQLGQPATGTVMDDTFVIASATRLVALEPSTGRVVHSQGLARRQAPVIVNGRVVTVSTKILNPLSEE